MTGLRVSYTIDKPSSIKSMDEDVKYDYYELGILGSSQFLFYLKTADVTAKSADLLYLTESYHR